MQAIKLNTKAKWTLDAVRSEIGFKVKHLMVSNVRGEFKEYGARIYATGEDFLNAEVDFWINPATISTGDKARNEHLIGPDFFDVKRFPSISFKGKSFEAVSGEMYALYGDLTIKRISKVILLDVELSGVSKDPQGGQRAGLVVTGKINRKDWGLTWSTVMESGGLIVGEDIFIKCEIELIKQSESSL